MKPIRQLRMLFEKCTKGPRGQSSTDGHSFPGPTSLVEHHINDSLHEGSADHRADRCLLPLQSMVAEELPQLLCRVNAGTRRCMKARTPYLRHWKARWRKSAPDHSCHQLVFSDRASKRKNQISFGSVLTGSSSKNSPAAVLMRSRN